VKLKPLVGIDCDGVLSDFSGAFVEESRKLLKKPKKGFIQHAWNFTDCGWTKLEEKQVMAHLRSHYNFWRTLERLPGTGDLKRRLDDLNLFFITARMSTDGAPVAYQTADWLHDSYGIRDPYVIVAEKKGPVVADLELDYFIDDKPEHVKSVKASRPECKVAICDATWNQDFKDSRIERVENLNAFLKEIKG